MQKYENDDEELLVMRLVSLLVACPLLLAVSKPYLEKEEARHELL